MKTACLLTAALGLSSATALAQPFPLAALPADPSGETSLEAVIVIDDLRAVRVWSEANQRYLKGTALGRAYLEPAMQTRFLGFDLYSEMDRWVALAAPSGGAVPVALAVLSRGEVIGGQLMVKVEPGFMERAAAAKQGPYLAPWIISGGPDQVRLAVKDTHFTGRVGKDGWLRLATHPELLLEGGGQGRALFSEELGKWTQGSPVTAAIFGGGMFSRFLASLTSDPTTQMMIADMRALAFTMQLGEQLDSALRILVDAPMLQQFGGMLRKPDLANTPVSLWDDDATMMVSLALPPTALSGVMMMGQMMLAETPYAIPEDVAQSLSALEGRLSFVDFGSPSDWAVGVELSDASLAAQLVPALQRWIVKLSQGAGVESPQSLAVMQPFPGLPQPLLLLRPDEVLEGLNVTNIGKTVVAVRQKSRLTRLVNLAQTKKGSVLEAPLTGILRSALERPAMLQFYSVANSDGSFLEWFVWPSKALEGLAKTMGATLPQQGPLGPPSYDFSRLPLTLAAAAYATMFIYDYSVAVDVRGPILFVEIASSQL